MFEYFPKNYTWSFATVMAIDLSGAVSEINDACRPLQEASIRNDRSAQEEWFESWKKIADRVNAFAITHEEAGQLFSAGRKYRRAALYYLMAERMLPHPHSWREEAYKKGLSAFKESLRLRKEPAERVDIPFQGKSIPAIFSRAPVKGASPCMVHFNGFDGIKETSYMTLADDFRQRGVSVLFIDQPGTGEALRFRNMYARADTEVPAAACVDYLETRSEVDPNRIGVMGTSLGGYYAPRAAAFERRFKCCVAWAANYNFAERTKLRLVGKGGELAQPDYANRLMWVFGKGTIEEAVPASKDLTLEGVLDKITCPLLVVHGENDRIIPLWEAEKTIEEAVNSPNRKLKVFTFAEGGEDHCQLDNYSMGADYITDWVSETLGGNPKGV
jgi:dienelactone hydrolase